MGGIDTGGDKRSVDVNLNITPFVDLLVCLTAFLLVTAVWQNLAQINIKPKGMSQDPSEPIDDEEKAQVSVHITEPKIWVGVSLLNLQAAIPKKGKNYDWPKLTELLTKYKKNAQLEGRSDIEIAADPKVEYQELVSAMEGAVAAQFTDVNMMNPRELTVKFAATVSD